MSNDAQERLTDLLAERAVQPLGAAEARELEQLLAQYPGTDEAQFDRAAAAMHLTEAMKPEALPTHLKSKVIADAREFFGIEEPLRTVAPMATNVISFPTEREKRNPWQWFGWVAAAACLLLALIGWWPRVTKQWNNSTTSTLPVAQSNTEKIQTLLAQAKDIVQKNWTPTRESNVQAVSGDIVWSSEKQEGYMRFTNLAANDPNKNVYQLWIFDANQDEKYPVDGGVFNVSQAGEVIVPIQAKLKITKPTLFAVTIEKPGGVVVSKRDKLILTAKVG